MDLVGRHGRRGRGLERPAVIFVAVRARPHAGDVGRDGALGLQLGDLALERGRDLARRRSCGPGRPNRRRCLSPWSGGRASRRGCRPACAFFSAMRELVERLVDQEVRRDEALARGPSASAPSSPSSWRGILREAAEIGLGVGAVFDRVVGVEELRRVDVGADILDHDIGRVAPAADGDVAVGQGKAFERGRGRRSARLRRWCGRGRTGGDVSIASARARSALTRRPQRRCWPAAERSLELGAQLRAAPGVDAERGRAFRDRGEAGSRRPSRAARWPARRWRGCGRSAGVALARSGSAAVAASAASVSRRVKLECRTRQVSG